MRKKADAKPKKKSVRKSRAAPAKKRKAPARKKKVAKSPDRKRGAKPRKQKAVTRRTRTRKIAPREYGNAIEGELPVVVREIETVLKSRELLIRGYWDRYPSADQKRHKNKYDSIPKAERRGPTAYDLLYRDYNSFTAAQRKTLRLRVLYGVAADSGAILTPQKIVGSHLSIDLHQSRDKALLSLSALLVRAGVIDSPKEWKVNKNASRLEHAIPLGIEWVSVKQSTKPAKRHAHRDKFGRFAKKEAPKKRGKRSS